MFSVLISSVLLNYGFSNLYSSQVATKATGVWTDSSFSPGSGEFRTDDLDNYPLEPWLTYSKASAQHSLTLTSSTSNSSNAQIIRRTMAELLCFWDLSSSVPPPTDDAVTIEMLVEWKVTATAASTNANLAATGKGWYKKNDSYSVERSLSGVGNLSGLKSGSFKFSQTVRAFDILFGYENGTYTAEYERAFEPSVAYSKAAGVGRSATATGLSKIAPKITKWIFTSPASAQLDILEGSATGLPLGTSGLWVDCYTNNGVVVESNYWVDVNVDQEWSIFVDSSPAGVTYFTVKVNPENCLKKAYTVAVPTSGRPYLSISYSDFKFGDVNRDNVITQADIDLVQEAVGIPQSDPRWDTLDVSPTNPQTASSYDFNNSGSVDFLDVAMVSTNLGQVGD